MLGRDVVVLCVSERFELVGTSFNGDGFEVAFGVGVVGFDNADVVEEKFVAAAAAEHAAFEEHSHFWGGALGVVGHDFNDYGHFVRRVAFENDVFEHHFFVTDAGTFFNRAFDHVAGDTLFAGFFHRREETRIGAEIRAAEFGSDSNFFDDFADRLTFFQVNDCAFCVKPLASHA